MPETEPDKLAATTQASGIDTGSTELDSPATLTVCRVCLVDNVKLYHILEHKLGAMFERVTGVEVNPEDELPQKICWECVARLKSANNFKIKALKAQWILKNKHSGLSLITISDIKSIDRAEHQLESTLGSKIYKVYDCNFDIVKETVAVGIINERNNETVDKSDEINSNEYMRETELIVPKKEVGLNDEEQIWIAEIDISYEKDPIKTEQRDVSDEEDIKNKSSMTTYNEPDVKCELGSTDMRNMELIICKEEHISNDEIELYNESNHDDASQHIYLSNYSKRLAANDCHSSTRDTNILEGRNTFVETVSNSTDTIEVSKLSISNPGSSTSQAIGTNMSMVHTNKIMLNDTKSLDKLFICDTCNKSFHHKYSLIRHILKPHNNYNCTYCSYKTNLESHLDVHINAKHTKNTLFNCSLCSYKTYDKRALYKHNVKYANIFSCSHCSFKTHQKGYLSLHVKTNHADDISYDCSYCSYKANQKGHLNRHVNAKHTKSVSYDCSYCSYKAYSKGILLEHVNAKHTKSIFYNCSYCSYKTFRKGRLDAHVNAKHTKSVSFDCSYCSFKTYQKDALYLHINSKHTDNSSLICSFCSYKAPNHLGLDRHVNVMHTKLTSFNCSYCSYKTYLKINLSKHINAKHTKSASFNCSYCSFETFEKKSLERHVNATHTKSTSYNCTHCSYKAYDTGSLSKHINAKHTKITYNCSHCDFKSYYRSALNRHVKVKHS